MNICPNKLYSPSLATITHPLSIPILAFCALLSSVEYWRSASTATQERSPRHVCMQDSRPLRHEKIIQTPHVEHTEFSIFRFLRI